MKDQDFLQAMRNSPEDTFLVQVYADWLEENNDSRYRILRSWMSLETVVDEIAVSPGESDPDFSDLQIAMKDYHNSFYENRCEDWLAAVGTIRPWISAKTATQLGHMYAREHRRNLVLHNLGVDVREQIWQLSFLLDGEQHSSKRKILFREYVIIDRTFGEMERAISRDSTSSLRKRLRGKVQALFG